MIFFLRSYYVEQDPRLQRYIKALSLNGLPSHCISWDRLAKEKDTSNITYFKKSARTGAGILNTWNLIKWNIFCLRELLARKQEVTAVHAIDLDTGFVAAVFSILTQKPLIYDAFDLYSASRATNPLLTKLLDNFERWVIRRSTHTILPDECRREQYKISHYTNIKIIENIPISDREKKYSTLSKNRPSSIKFVYAGALAEKHRGIEDLLEWAAKKGNDITLEIAGAGVLQELCQKMAVSHKNIIFYGNISNREALSLMENAHVILGFYYLSSPNHRYAAPNKYFEHLLIGRPLLTTTGTPPGDKVSTYNSGWAIDEGISALDKWWSNFTWNDACKKGGNATAIWSKNYADYFEKTLLKTYIDLIKQNK